MNRKVKIKSKRKRKILDDLFIPEIVEIIIDFLIGPQNYWKNKMKEKVLSKRCLSYFHGMPITSRKVNQNILFKIRNLLDNDECGICTLQTLKNLENPPFIISHDGFN